MIDRVIVNRIWRNEKHHFLPILVNRILCVAVLPFVVHAILIVWTAEIQTQKIVRLSVGMVWSR